MAFSNGALLIGFIVCLFGALFTWYAADQYRNQLLSDSHRLVRELALRYQQGLVILTTLFGLGMVVTFLLLVGSLIGGDEPEPGETPQPETSETTTADPLSSPAGPTPTPTEQLPIPTATMLSPELDPTLSAAQTATVGGTNGLGVNLRDAPGIESNIIGNIPDGMPVTLTGESEFVDGLNWVSVISPDGARGWVTDLFLIFDP